MNDQTKIQLTRNKRDAIIDIISLIVFTAMVYFVFNPGGFDWLTRTVSNKIEKMTHQFSVWQTKLSIRSLPETDES